ncbi:hypothetical protein L3X38_017134 [Prunus dulcis]|uniref:DUF4219 domain-containing protein n=1 Tax=Prunus dulcis TaxID=3755 RepID=A0AAD4W6Q8_PRUDU|nr:hypothetical protein L3X38_017134 [Prunus dulcis]
MAGSGGSDLRAPIFNGDNYEFWNIRMRTIFKSHGIWDLVEKGIQIPDSKGKKVDEVGSSDSEKEALLMKDAKALGIIQGAISEDVRSIKLQGLRRDFEYTRMRDDETLSGYLTRLFELVNQMKGYGEDLSKGRTDHRTWDWLVFGDNEVDIYEDKQLKELIARVQMKGNRCFPLDLKYVNPPMANRATFGEPS